MIPTFESWLSGNTNVVQKFDEDAGALQYLFAAPLDDNGSGPFRRLHAAEEVYGDIATQLRAMYDGIINAVDSLGRPRYGSDPFEGYAYDANVSRGIVGAEGARFAPVTIDGASYVRYSDFAELAGANPKYAEAIAAAGVTPAHFQYSAEYGSVVPFEVYAGLVNPLAAAGQKHDFSSWLNDFLVRAPFMIGAAATGAMIGGAFAGVDVVTGATYEAGSSGLFNLLSSQAPAPVIDLAPPAELPVFEPPLLHSAPLPGANIGKSIYELVNAADPIEGMWHVEQFGGPAAFNAPDMLTALKSVFSGAPEWFSAATAASIQLPSVETPKVTAPAFPVDTILKAVAAPAVGLAARLITNAAAANEIATAEKQAGLAPGALSPGGALTVPAFTGGAALLLAGVSVAALIVFRKKLI